MEIDGRGNYWYKGNLHAHTTRSDGRKPPEDAISLYRERGYDFLALTDHWVLEEGYCHKDFLLLSGCEYDSGQNVEDGIYHIVGIGMEGMPRLRREDRPSPQELIDGIHEKGGIAILAHPAWSLNRAEEACRLRGLDGCEIYNTVSGIPWNCRPYSGVFLDEMAIRGVSLPCMAADDAHYYSGDEARSFLMVQAKDLSWESILEAIRLGDFYATQGPRFQVDIHDGLVHVTTTPVKNIVFFTDWIWEGDRVTWGDDIREAYFKIKPNDHWVRIELTDAQGNMAWSSFYQV